MKCQHAPSELCSKSASRSVQKRHTPWLASVHMALRGSSRTPARAQIVYIRTLNSFSVNQNRICQITIGMLTHSTTTPKMAVIMKRRTFKQGTGFLDRFSELSCEGLRGSFGNRTGARDCNSRSRPALQSCPRSQAKKLWER